MPNIVVQNVNCNQYGRLILIMLPLARFYIITPVDGINIDTSSGVSFILHWKSNRWMKHFLAFKVKIGTCWL
jgi:hypothetical protein